MNSPRMKFQLVMAIVAVLCPCSGYADIPLIGNHLPGKSVNDGDFEEMQENWRRPEQSPYWASHFKGGWKAGFAQGLMTGSGSQQAYFETVDLEGPVSMQSTRAFFLEVWRSGAGIGRRTGGACR